MNNEIENIIDEITWCFEKEGNKHVTIDCHFLIRASHYIILFASNLRNVTNKAL